MFFHKIFSRSKIDKSLVISAVTSGFVYLVVLLSLERIPGCTEPSSWFFRTHARFNATVHCAWKIRVNEKLSVLISPDEAEPVCIMNDMVAIPVLFFCARNFDPISDHLPVVTFFCRGFPNKADEPLTLLADSHKHAVKNELAFVSRAKLLLPIRAGTYLIFASVTGQVRPLGVIALKPNALGNFLKSWPKHLWLISTNLKLMIGCILCLTLVLAIAVDKARYSKSLDCGSLSEDAKSRAWIAFTILITAVSFPPIQAYSLGLLFLSALPAFFFATQVKKAGRAILKKLNSFAPTEPEAPLVLGKVHFPGLNQVRLLAAFLVIFCHIEQIKSWYGIQHGHPLLEAQGGPGVTLFFVLSGFLITFLLLQELAKQNKVAIKKFYLRRLLRIWPLYYFVVLTSFFVLPHFWHAPPGHLSDCSAALPQNFWTKLLLYLFFLPGLCSIAYTAIPFASQCWSLGVEEQFYLFWPLFNIIFRRSFVWAAMTIMIARSVVLFWLDLCSKSFHPNNLLLNQLTALIDSFDADAFIMGGLGAWLMNSRPNLAHKCFQHPIAFAAIAATVMVCMCSSPNSQLTPLHFSFQPTFIRIAFSLMILSFAQRPVQFGFVQNFVDYLGRISYGLYMYHWAVAIFLTQWLLTYRRIADFNLGDDIFIYAMTIAVTIALSALSYKYLEYPFLRIKKMLEVVHT